MSELIEHRFSKALRELFLYCPQKYADKVWSEAHASWWAWKEQELLHRCCCERGFIGKLEAYIEELKEKRSKPHVDQSPSQKHNYRDMGKLHKNRSRKNGRFVPMIENTDIPLFRESPD